MMKLYLSPHTLPLSLSLWPKSLFLFSSIFVRSWQFQQYVSLSSLLTSKVTDNSSDSCNLFPFSISLVISPGGLLPSKSTFRTMFINVMCMLVDMTICCCVYDNRCFSIWSIAIRVSCLYLQTEFGTQIVFCCTIDIRVY